MTEKISKLRKDGLEALNIIEKFIHGEITDTKQAIKAEKAMTKSINKLLKYENKK